MKETYQEAINKVFEDEGGYSNDPGDSGGPTNWGITIADARMYWKSDATASDVRNMPKSVAVDIYKKHYAIPLHYDDLPAGVDYAVLDYGINSGIGRAARVLRQLQPTSKDSKDLINKIYDERLTFLRSLRGWPTFGRGWGRRCKEGRALALSMVDKYKPGLTTPIVTTAVIVSSGVVASTQTQDSHTFWIVVGVTGVCALIGLIVYWYRKHVVKA